MRIVLPSINRRRNPIMQALSLVVGLAVIGVLLVFGLVVAGVLLVGGAVFLAVRQWKRGRGINRPQSVRQPNVLEGEYVVIRNGEPVGHH